MKKFTKIALGVVAGGLALASVSAVVVAKDKMDGYRSMMMASAGEYGHGKGGRHGGRGFMKERMTKLFNEHDVNQDGAVTQAEVDLVRKQSLDKYDANKDGNLSLDEFEGLWLERMNSRMVRGFQHLDEDASGAVSTEEFIAPFSKIIDRHDTDGDGDVDEEELKKHMKKRGKWHHGNDRG